MTAEGHLLFSIACAVFAKNAELTPVLAQGDWWHIVPSAISVVNKSVPMVRKLILPN
jgi:membrane-bound metal-dependent hydrolase YbcI (DUF457 family)